MNAVLPPMDEVSHRARHALVDQLGVVDTLRFLAQFRSGNGDYSKERQEQFAGMSTGDIIAEIKARR